MNTGLDELVLTPRSPFARRVRIALRRLNWLVEEVMIDPFHPPEFLKEYSPLALVPILRFKPSNETWVDSQTILENLDELTGRIWPTGREDRILARQLSVWAQTVMQFAVNRYLEQMHATPDPSFIEEAVENTHRTLNRLVERLRSEPRVSFLLTEDHFITQPCLDWAIALEYLDLRMPELKWRSEFPSLQKIVGMAETLTDFQSTRPPPL
jgi:glutathione S-transferase